MTEGLRDLLERHGAGREALGLAALEERLRRLEPRARRDQQVVGLALHVAQGGRGAAGHARRQHPRGIDHEVAPPGFGLEAHARAARARTRSAKRAGSCVTSRIATGPETPSTTAVPDSDQEPSNCPERSDACCG